MAETAMVPSNEPIRNDPTMGGPLNGPKYPSTDPTVQQPVVGVPLVPEDPKALPPPEVVVEMMEVDDEPYDGPQGFYIGAALIIIGYICVWTGASLGVPTGNAMMCLLIGGVGLGIALTGLVLLLGGIRPFHERTLCKRLATAVFVIGGIGFVCYCTFLYMTLARSKSNANCTTQWCEQNAGWLEAYSTVAKVWTGIALTAAGGAMLGLTGCATGLGCCVMERKANKVPVPTNEPAIVPVAPGNEPAIV